MSDPAGSPPDDGSSDEELSTPPADLSELPTNDDGPSAAPTADPTSEALGNLETSPVLDEIDDSPVRTDNS